MTNKNSALIASSDVNKNLITFDDVGKKILYDQNNFVMSTPWIRITRDIYGNMTTHDFNIVNVFSMFDAVVGDKIKNTFVKKYVGKISNKQVAYVRFKLSNSLPEKEKAALSNVNGREFRIMLVPSTVYKNIGTMSWNIVRCQSREATSIEVNPHEEDYAALSFD